MALSRLANRWLNKLYKLLAVTLVLFAVLISALRIMLPYAENYRQEFQDFINQTYDSNIAFGSMSFEWQQEGPVLITENVRFLKTEMADLYIQKIIIQLDFWRTIKEQELKSHNLKLVGARINIDQTQVAHKKISKRESSLIENVSEMFLEKITLFSLENSQVRIKRENSEHVLNIEELLWVNQGVRHRATGKVSFDGLTENSLNLKLDVKGEKVSDMSGKVYLEASKLNITPWLDKVFSIDDEDTDANINFTAWLDIDKGLAKSMQLVVGESDITFSHHKQERRFHIKQGNVFAKNLDQPGHMTVESGVFEIFTEDYAWKPFRFSAYQEEGQEFAYISSVDLAGMIDLAPLFLSKEAYFSLIETMSPEGELNNLYIRQFAGDLQTTANFSNVTTLYSNSIPGIDNLSGEFVVSAGQFRISLLGENGFLDFDKNFKQPLPYQTLFAEINGKQEDSGWQLSVENMEVNSSELHLKADLGVDIPIDGDISMGLLASLSGVEAKNIPHYYPHLLMGENLVEYLTDSIVRGELQTAQILFNGPLANFPFEDSSGIFNVNAELSDSTFEFDSQWPAIHGFNANLNFINNSMLITGRSGKLQGVPVKGVTAAIDDLAGVNVLDVHLNFKDVQSNYVSKLLNKSSLADTVGATLKELVVSGLLEGYFDLTIPLDDTDNTVSKGLVKFNDNLINLQTPSMNFTNVKGELRFINDKVSTNDLSLMWAGLPLKLEVNAQSHERLYLTNIHLSADWKQTAWQIHVPEELKKYAKGTFSWEGDLRLEMYHNDDFAYSFDVTSLLKDLTLNLPAPYAKNAEHVRQLKAKASGKEIGSTVTMSLGLDEELTFYGHLNHEKANFVQAHLVAGKSDILLPLEGFYISTELGDIDYTQWQPFISDILSATSPKNTSDQESLELASSKAATPLIPAPEFIRGTVATIKVYDQKFTDVSFELKDKSQWWDLSLNAKEIRSEAKFYPDWLKEGIDINADFIHLNINEAKPVDIPDAPDRQTSEKTVKNTPQVSKAAKVEEHLNNDEFFAEFPKLKVSCASCRVGHADFGKVNFSVERDNDKIIVKDFSAVRGASNAHFNLVWQHNKNQSSTHLYGDLKVDNVEQEFKNFGYPSTVRDSGANVVYDFTWNNAPFDFGYATLKGDMSVELNEGYLADVSDSARIFSILSLQSLVRKLTLDFRDIFSDGMFYTYMKGDFVIKEGILYTSNTRMKGSAGDLSVKGNTNLNTNTLDYRMKYKPNLTSSLPVLAWVATLNPVTFLAGVALDEVITSQVVSELDFELTGNVNDPVMKEVNRKNKDVSVGRTTPPQIVEVTPEVDSATSPQKESNTKNSESKPQTPAKVINTNG